MASKLYLPVPVESVDLGESLDIPAGALRAAAPQWLNPRRPAADRALRYSRGRGGLTYEAIAERMQAALPAVPATLVHTRATARRERERDAAHRHNPDVDALIEQITPLRHRPLDLPQSLPGSFRPVGGSDHITVVIEDEMGSEEAWTFSLAHPPRIFMRDTVPAPPAMAATQRASISFPGTFWLPFSAIVQHGAFPRFQSARAGLQQSTEAGCLYLFLSHRWLSTSEPDPHHVQARFFAWQLFAAVCEAIELVGDRGLHEPRRASRWLNVPIGRFGSSFAESLVVNLLQPAMNDEQVTQAMREVAACAADLEDRGSSMADQDHGLRQLLKRLEAMPVTRNLLDRVFVWYDYSCLPQEPRSADDDLLFRDGLAHLNHAQLIGATAILLDEIDDYLGRAWCVLETITAGSLTALTGMQAFQLAASRRSTNRSGKAEHYNELLLRDAPHLVWRALLDTEVFACQTPEHCLERLCLSVTDPADLPIVYAGLRRMQAPDAPTDDFEVVSGCFPLPSTALNDAVYWRTQTTRKVADVPTPVATVHVDWTRALRLQDLREAIGERRPLGVPPLTSLLANYAALREPEALDGLHLAVVGSCEGEAMLIARWVRDHYAELEQLLGLRAVSISWLATDVVPVGCLSYGVLQPWPSRSYRWIVIATIYRLAQCEVTGHLIEMMRALGRPYGELAIDRAQDNFRWYEAREIAGAPRDVARYPIADGPLDGHRGGLYRGALLPYLMPARLRAPQ